LARRPHNHFSSRWQWYARWHGWNYHKHIHGVLLGAYVVAISIVILNVVGKTHALSDLSNSWDFSDSSQFTLGSGVEINGTTARLKAQNYTTDSNTVSLLHLDESSGTNVTDSSASHNDATAVGATWAAGNLNNAATLDGRSNLLRSPDTSSLSLLQSNSVEAWTKLSTSFSAGSHTQPQGIVDKGSYKLYYDQETGKVTYELANSSANTWTQQAGNSVKNSWDLNGKLTVGAQVMVGSNVYAGLGNAVGDAEVWKWNGTTWTQIGGEGMGDSWDAQIYENVNSMAVIGTTLYAGLGSSTGDAEVWSCDTATGCTAWTKVGGDALNSSWAVSRFEEADSMTVMGTNLYVGLGNTANDAQVWKWNGTTWTQVGGFGIGAPYNAFTTGYEGVYSLTNDGTNVYAGMGSSTGDADVWRLTGTTWTQIGGDGTGWVAATYETVISMRYFGSNLYAGLGSSTGDGSVWKYNGSTWTEIGGDGTGWAASTYEGVYSFTDDGTNLYAGLGSTAGDNEIWKYNGTTWTQIGGDGLNSGFTNTHTVVQSMTYGGGKLYAGLQATAANAAEWSYDGTAWTKIGGGYLNNSWGYYNLQDVDSMTVSGDYLYAGTGNATAGNAQVWQFNGSTWHIVGGQGINSSWAADTYEGVSTLQSYGGNLYAGLGTGTGDGSVWKYNGTSWTKIGGDGTGWAASRFEKVNAMTVMSGSLYVGLGVSANDAQVWKYNGTTWTQVGGFGIGAPYNAFPTGYENVLSLSVYGGNLMAGMGTTAGDADVWVLSGTTWTQIGGDAKNNGWASATYEEVDSLAAYNGKLYAGLGTTAGDAEIWAWDGTNWTFAGGDGLSGSWDDGQYEMVRSLAVYNGMLYAGLGTSAGDGEVWSMDNGSWTKIGGGNANGSWAASTIETVQSLAVYHGKLYAGLGNTANADAQVWSFGNNGFLQSATATQDTSWHHIAATYDGTTMKLYIDGSLNAQTASTLSMPDNDLPLLTGSLYGTTATGDAQGYFTGSLDEVRISNIARDSFTALPYNSTPQLVTLTNPIRPRGVWHWDGFLSGETANGGTITYRLSADGGTTWLYWDGAAWSTSSSVASANDAATMNAHMASFSVTFYGLKWQAVLSGNGRQQVTLNTVGTTATADTTAPTAATGGIITANKVVNGTSLASNAWTNSASPSFAWPAGSDASAGITGYCLYLGTDGTADPVTTAGLLGNSPSYSGNNCQFMVGANTADMGISGYIGTALATSTNPYYLVVKSIDKAGNVSNTSTAFHFRFDNTAPANPSFITAPSGFVNTKQVQLSWPISGGGAASDPASGVAGLQYRIGNTGTWYGDSHSGTGDAGDLLTDDGSYTTQDNPDFANLSEGVNTVYFRTWDAAGNVSPIYVTAALKINTSGAPSEPQSIVATPSVNNTNAFAFNWAAPAQFVGDVSTLTYCYTINSLPAANNCTFTPAGVTALGSGPYATQPGQNTLYVVAKDESGNINYASYGSTNFSANTPAPGMPLNVDIVDVSIKTTSNWRLALTWDAPSDVGAGINTYKVFRSTDNVTFTPIGASSSTTYIDAGLQQHTYYYKVAACDSTNNCGAASSVVNDLPTGKFTAPATLVAEPIVANITTRKATISWSTDRTSDSKIALGTVSGHYASSEISSSDQVSAHQIQLDNLAAGTTYYYVAKWTDADGNTGTSQEYSFTTAPAPSFKSVATQTVGLTSATIQFTTNNASKVALYYGPTTAFGGLKLVNTAMAESTYSVQLTGLNDATKYLYQLVSYDSEGNAYSGDTYNFTTPAAPHIANLRFQPVAGQPTSTQMVTWTTNTPTTSTITYGIQGTDGTEMASATLTTDHSVTITDLVDDSQYFLLAQSRDKDGNLALSDKQIFRTALDTRPPKITNISVESSIRGTGADARGQVVVSWHTDELATSQVAYAEGSSASVFNNKTAQDTGMSFDHIVIVSDLPTSKVYSVQPVSLDKAGNVATGKPQAAIIGHASDSVLTIVLNTLQGVFGF
jgi:hypothetical protein